MKEASISLSLVIFGWYTLYVAYKCLDALMMGYTVNPRGYVILVVSALITLILIRKAYVISHVGRENIKEKKGS